MRQRFAAQRLLAEGPRAYITPELTEALEELAGSAVSQGAESGRELSARRAVGPALVDEMGNPVQMYLKASASPLYIPMDSEIIMKEGVNQLLARQPKQIGTISFGWYGGSGRPYRQNKELVKQAEGFNYKDALAKAMIDAVDKIGLRENDLISNSPLRERANDYRRPVAYMANGGFGPISSERQFAFIGSSGAGEPALFSPADAGFMKYMKWKEGPLSGSPPPRKNPAVSYEEDSFDDFSGQRGQDIDSWEEDFYHESLQPYPASVGPDPIKRDLQALLRDIDFQAMRPDSRAHLAHIPGYADDLATAVASARRGDPKVLEALRVASMLDIAAPSSSNYGNIQSRTSAAESAMLQAIIEDSKSGRLSQEEALARLVSMRRSMQNAIPF